MRVPENSNSGNSGARLDIWTRRKTFPFWGLHRENVDWAFAKGKGVKRRVQSSCLTAGPYDEVVVVFVMRGAKRAVDFQNLSSKLVASRSRSRHFGHGNDNSFKEAHHGGSAQQSGRTGFEQRRPSNSFGIPIVIGQMSNWEFYSSLPSSWNQDYPRIPGQIGSSASSLKRWGGKTRSKSPSRMLKRTVTTPRPMITWGETAL